VRPELLEIIVCRHCAAPGSLVLEKQEVTQTEVRSGHVKCRLCSASYTIVAGVLDLLPTDLMRKEVSSEVHGWDEANEGWFDLTGRKSNFWLVEPDNKETEGISSDEFIRRLPNFDRICQKMHNEQSHLVLSIFEVLQAAQLKGTERVLDLGAARCWTTREFAKRGCTCVATDITLTRYVGLATSDVYFEETPTMYWERVRCDMESLPFMDGSFDIVFCSAVLHHSKDPLKVILNLRRILAPGGRILVVNEPDYGMLDYRQALKGQEAEASLGVNENLYNYHMFLKFFRKAGFHTNFFSPISAAKYNGWRARLLLERMGLGLDPTVTQEWFTQKIVKYHHCFRYFFGLGTMGIATKLD